MAPLAAHAQQWIPNGPPNVIASQVITTGSVSYFRLVAELPGGSCCQRISGSNVTRQGTNLHQILEQEQWGGGCIDLFCDSWLEAYVSVLGALPPGEYSLNLSAIDPFFGGNRTWGTYRFSVPVNSTRTLTLSQQATTNGPLLLIQVAGMPEVNYVLESSANLTSWTPMKTNLGPVLFSIATTNGVQRFYRTSIVAAPAHGASTDDGEGWKELK